MCSDSPARQRASHHPLFIHPAAANNTPSSSRLLALCFLYIKEKYFSDVEVAAKRGIFMPFKLLPSNCAAIAHKKRERQPQKNKESLRISSLSARDVLI
jgi:hypothetical protein